MEDSIRLYHQLKSDVTQDIYPVLDITRLAAQLPRGITQGEDYRQLLGTIPVNSDPFSMGKGRFDFMTTKRVGLLKDRFPTSYLQESPGGRLARLYRKISDLVLQKKTQNLPLFYTAVIDQTSLHFRLFSEVTLPGSLANLVREEKLYGYSKERLQSLYFQIGDALHVLHLAGILHGSLSWSSIKMKPGPVTGHTTYRVYGKEVAVENLGFIPILSGFEFARSAQVTNSLFTNDDFQDDDAYWVYENWIDPLDKYGPGCKDEAAKKGYLPASDNVDDMRTLATLYYTGNVRPLQLSYDIANFMSMFSGKELQTFVASFGSGEPKFDPGSIKDDEAKGWVIQKTAKLAASFKESGYNNDDTSPEWWEAKIKSSSVRQTVDMEFVDIGLHLYRSFETTSNTSFVHVPSQFVSSDSYADNSGSTVFRGVETSTRFKGVWNQLARFAGYGSEASVPDVVQSISDAAKN